VGNAVLPRVQAHVALRRADGVNRP